MRIYLLKRKEHAPSRENSPDTRKGIGSGIHWYSCLDISLSCELKWYESVKERLSNILKGPFVDLQD